jgi:DNA-binding beta-propeller fold protein YncE
MAVVAAIPASAAGATGSIYWSTLNSIEFTDLSGFGVTEFTPNVAQGGPIGTAIDAATGRIYWASAQSNKISYANLDGTGGGTLPTGSATIDNPEGIAIDPGAGKIYWANFGGNKISYAYLNGSGGGDLTTTGTVVHGPIGVAVDPAAGRVCWANANGNDIACANTDGSGGASYLNTTGATTTQPSGVAIDPVTQRIYWGTPTTISYAALNGTGGGDLNTYGAIVNHPIGVAIDPIAGRIYWTGFTSPHSRVAYANLDGSGGDLLGTTGAYASFPSLLEAPSPSGAPVVSGGSFTGSTLTCSQGSWAPDLVSAFLSRAPQSFIYSWFRNGSQIAAPPRSTTLHPSLPGDYTCRVTALNFAGSASQVSGPRHVTPRAPPASRIYWGDSFSDQISFANLNGSGAGDLGVIGTTVNHPYGMAVDAAAGRMYWANVNTISFANLDGGGGGNIPTGGATVNQPTGLALDPSARRVYWANFFGDTISFANLNGSGGGDLTTTGATVDHPAGVAIDPATGRIYWANYGDGKISYARLNNTGGGDLNTGAAKVNDPWGVALDVSAGRIYWPNIGGGSISYAKLNGSGGGNLPIGAAKIEIPVGVAIDPTAGRIYWANETGGISFARLDGSGGGEVPTLAADTTGAAFPVLLEPPAAGGAPKIAGGSTPGSTLACSRGTWAPDLLGAFLFRAPEGYAYRWTRNGSPLPGGTQRTLRASLPGVYRCESIASNVAGQTAQTSAARKIALRPTITSAVESHRTWRDSNELASLAHASARRPPVGTTFSLRLNEPATLHFRFTHSSGTPAGVLSVAGHRGLDQLRFFGRLSPRRRLMPGTYSLVITATAAGQTSHPARLQFRIVS